MKHLYHVAIAPGVDYDCVADEEAGLGLGDRVVIRCERYQDIGTIVECHPEVALADDEADERHTQGSRGRQIEGKSMPKVIRRASAADEIRGKENDARAESALHVAVDQVALHALDMKLVNAHVSFDRRLVILQFSAEGRVDFRELLRDLSRRLHMRVELRQIGVRDEASIQGGIGACGRAFCCTTFLRRFHSINVKMAKQQGLSLNPASISGCCGRLKCCLHYEAHLYRNGRLIDAPEEPGRDAQEPGRGRPGRAGSRRGSPRSRPEPSRPPRSAGAERRRDAEGRSSPEEPSRPGPAPSPEGKAGDGPGNRERQEGRPQRRRRRRRRSRSRPSSGGSSGGKA